MLAIIKNSFNLTNKFIVLATPLIFFSLLSGLYLLFSGKGNLLNISIAFILYYFMLAAFLSGWFVMITKCIKNTDENPNSLILEFPSGVGEYFLPTVLMLLNSFIIALVFMVIAFLTGKYFIGSVGISNIELSNAMISQETLKTFLSSLSNEQLIKLNLWNITILAFLSLYYFFIMFYSPTLFFVEKNPIKSLFLSIKCLFKRHFFKNIVLFMFIGTSYIIISLLSAFSGTNIIVHFFVTLLNFYYIVYIAVLVYNYYYVNYAKIGSTIDTSV